MKYLLLILLFSVHSYILSAQASPEFIPPMDIPLILSGNFGELRNDHFHSGIDIKTQGVSGIPVKAIQSGFVSRIKVQRGGYGKALYIAHPGGYTSVYGHLSAYNKEIDAYVKKIQYHREAHEVDIYLKKDELLVEKGEQIALSGNSGSSSGPHLHFEIRRTSDQHPLNVLQFDFPVKDHIPPQIKRIGIYPITAYSHVRNSQNPYFQEIINSNGRISLESNSPIPVYGKIGIGTEIYDYLDDAPNRCGIFSLELLLDGKQVYHSEMSEFSFAESRFINAHIDYAMKIRKRQSIQKMFRSPYNKLSIYKYIENEGVINILDTSIHELTIKSMDTYGNLAEVQFKLKGAPQSMQVSNGENCTGQDLPYNAPSTFSDRNIELRFPAYCFYEDLCFNFARTQGEENVLSDIYHIHNEETPVHQRFEISIEIPDIYETEASKLCLLLLEEDEWTFAGGVYKEGKLNESIRNFGKYAIGIDTLSPSIYPLNFYKGKDLGTSERISFSVEDDLSGILSYRGTIDGEWVLFEYDPKNELLFYEFDKNVPISNKNHELELQLTDSKGNTANYQTVFYR